MRNHTRNSAFTLLEMAVVVAIVGLLAGGILAGASYIRSARLTTTINEAKYYTAQLNLFEQKYSAVAGDMSNAQSYFGTWGTCPPTAGTTITTGSCNGDGNSLIGTSNNPELFLVFDHLAKSGLVMGKFSGATGSGSSLDFITGTNIPSTPISGAGYYFGEVGTSSLLSGDTNYFDGTYIHPMFIGTVENTTDSTLGAFVSPSEMLKLDLKYDNGKPGSGTIRSVKPAYLSGCASSAVALTANYQVSDEPKCILIFSS